MDDGSTSRTPAAQLADNATISGNAAGGNGGGLSSYDGAVALPFVTVTGNIANPNDDGVGSGGFSAPGVLQQAASGTLGVVTPSTP